jgi:hypothetical protein
MKTTVIILLFSVLVLSGCTRHYVMTMNNGTQIVAASKPRLQGGTYYFKDAAGREQVVPQGRVREVSPGTHAKTEANPFKVGPDSAPSK